MKTRSIWGSLTLPLAVFAVGAALSVVVAAMVRQDIARGAQQQFDSLAADVARKVEGRFDDYIAVLTGLRARFNTSETVTRSDFRDYVAGLNLKSSYPGFLVLNYAPYVVAADRHRFEEQFRRDASLDGRPPANFSIYPPGERADYYPLTLVEPLAGNEQLLGRDLGAMPNRGNALEQARDSGGLVSSGRKIDIKGKPADIALAMRLPVYRPQMPLESVEQRRAAYIGSVGAGFRVAAMMRDVIAGDAAAALRLRLIDAGPSGGAIGTRVESRFVPPEPYTANQVLFDSADLRAPAATQNSSQAASAASGLTMGRAPRLERTLGFELGGHSWLVEVGEDERQLIGPLNTAMPWLIAAGGLAMSTLLAGIVLALTTARSRAVVLATAMTSHLRASQRQLAEAQHLASLGSWVLDARTGMLDCSDEARRILGFDAAAERPDLAALLSRVPVEERSAVEGQMVDAPRTGQRSEFEHRLCLPDGTERWVHVTAQWIEEDGKALLQGAVRDDTLRRQDELRQKLEYEIAKLLVGEGDAVIVLSKVLEAICIHQRWDCGTLWTVHDDNLAHCNAAWHAETDAALTQFVHVSQSLSYRRDEGPLGRAWAAGDAVRVDTRIEQQDFTRNALAAQAGLTVGLIVPMATTGAAAALEFFSRNPNAATADALELLRVIALQIAQYQQRKQAEHKLRFMANHDALTGLSNRATLERELARAIKRSRRTHKRFAVMFADMDRFKRINDTLGHGVGDELIKAYGERLSAALREDDTVARFGGDEFVLLLENLSDAGDAALLVERVQDCCARPFVIDGHELHVSSSLGVSIFPEDGDDAETLLKNADTAMFLAKDTGPGGHRFYASQMNAQSSERLKLEAALRRALERGELEMHYQPKMNLGTQDIVGVEALMRWRHPELGMISPAKFIPIAEETGLIEAMGKWALERACSDLRAWQQRGLLPVQMSVNLSPRQLSSPTLIADIDAVLTRSGVDPSLLELEITEGAMMTNPEHAAVLLQQIRSLGVDLAIDDFGTGYSSLSYLRRFPLTAVKIDRSFINDLSHDADAQALTDGIITLAHGLRMKVVAEGVETPAQVAHLRIHGCDEIQGYWLCKPVPADELCRFLARHQSKQFAAPMAA
ncbi:MAG TPA: EAL domain-containing protein [Burkholderiaceae bacterium]|nr:EAL domain-containing protein [Burkholderiaceae bacterium]